MRRLERLGAPAGGERSPARRRAAGRVGQAGPEPEPAVVLDLVAAASAAGAGVTAALAAVGEAVGGARGAALVEVGAALDLGTEWSAAWADVDPALAVAGVVLRPTWERGARAGPALRAAADAVRRERHSRALEAAGRLGTRLVLPLGLCYLPAFVLVGLAPVIISMAAGASAG